MFLGVFVAGLQNAHVLVDYGLALVAEGVGEHRGGSDFKVEPEKEDQRADGHRVLHNRSDGSKGLD